MSDNVQEFPKALSAGGAPSTSEPAGAHEAETMGLPPLPPHFWVIGWPWLTSQIGPHQALACAVSLDRPDPAKHPEAFQAVSRFEHDCFLRLNRSEVWAQAITLIKEVKDINTFILEAGRRGKAELTAL